MCNFKKLFCSVFFVMLIGINYAQPDKIRAVFTDDPSTKINIIFNTASENTNPILYYGTNPTQVNSNTSAKAFKDNTLSNESFGMYNTFVVLNNLTPDTKYYFKISDSDGSTPTYYFETIPDNPNKRLSFICGGDSRQNKDIRIIANTVVSKLKPHAVFFDGDFTDNGTDEQWQDWLENWQSSISSDGRITPLVPARGNHERNNAELTKLFGTNSTAVYSLSFGGNLFKAYTLNSQITTISYSSQTVWLKDQLQNDGDYFYRFAQYHQPARPHTALKNDGAAQYAYWSPLFYQYNVDLVLEGDSHMASTTYPIIPCTGGYGCVDGFMENEVNGTVYTGQGSWGAPLRPADDIRPWTFYGKRINQFKLIFVDKEKIELRTIDYPSSFNAGISEVNVNDRFNLPNNLFIEPGVNKLTGAPQDVLVIPSKKASSYPEIEIAYPIENSTYYEQVDVDVIINNISPQNEINAVVFYLNGVNIGLDNSKPFSFKINKYYFNVAQTYEINAIAYDVNNVASPIAFKRIKFKNGVLHTVSSKLKDSFNDAEELPGKRTDVGNFDLDMGYNETVCGLRFTNINVPPNANIVNARIQFTADERKINNTNLEFFGEDYAYSLEFLPSYSNITDRIKTPISVDWSSVPNWESVGDIGSNQKTPNLATIVQYLVNKPDWLLESPVTFIVEGEGYRVSETYDSNPDLTPVLTIDYTGNNQILSAYCVNYSDTILVNSGANIDIIGAGFSNSTNITKVEFIQNSTGSILRTANTNPVMLNYTVSVNETITIKATDDAGNSALKNIVIITSNLSTCLDPININIHSTRPNSIIINWNDVPDTYYKFYYKALTENDWKEHCTPVSTMFLYGLNACTKYQYQIQLICGDYNSCNDNSNFGYITSILDFETTDCVGAKTNDTNAEYGKEYKSIIFNAYPNPIEDILYVDLEVKQEVADGKVNLLNEKGEILLSKRLQNNKNEHFEFNTANLPKGNYTLEVNNGLENQKEIIKK